MSKRSDQFKKEGHGAETTPSGGEPSTAATETSAKAPAPNSSTPVVNSYREGIKPEPLPGNDASPLAAPKMKIAEKTNGIKGKKAPILLPGMKKIKRVNPKPSVEKPKNIFVVKDPSP